MVIYLDISSLQRNLAAAKTCDIIIAVSNPLNVQKSQLEDQINQESNTFVSQFIQQQAGHQVNGGNYYHFNEIGSNQISNSYFIQLFLKAVTPVKQSSYVLSVEPQNLLAYGGETVVITGNNFLTSQKTGIQTTKISFLGVDCKFISVTNTQIKCISGESKYYNPSQIQQTQILLGEESAFMFTHVNYVFNHSDKAHMKYVQNNLINQNQIKSIRLGLGLNLDVGQEYQSDQLNFDTIQVDGYLFFQSRRDLSITINLLSGIGIFSLGSQNIRINSNFQVQINILNIQKVRSYGRKLQKYNYSLLNQLSPSSTQITLNENPVFLQKGKIQTLLFLFCKLAEMFKSQQLLMYQDQVCLMMYRILESMFHSQSLLTTQQTHLLMSMHQTLKHLINISISKTSNQVLFKHMMISFLMVILSKIVISSDQIIRILLKKQVLILNCLKATSSKLVCQQLDISITQLQLYHQVNNFLITQSFPQTLVWIL
ncbi:hypothetical protein ABPG72_018048 [Tetrahymena utriculariae]